LSSRDARRIRKKLTSELAATATTSTLPAQAWKERSRSKRAEPSSKRPTCRSSWSTSVRQRRPSSKRTVLSLGPGLSNSGPSSSFAPQSCSTQPHATLHTRHASGSGLALAISLAIRSNTSAFGAPAPIRRTRSSLMRFSASTSSSCSIESNTYTAVTAAIVSAKPVVPSTNHSVRRRDSDQLRADTVRETRQTCSGMR
jgi:hypothetical protein